MKLSRMGRAAGGKALRSAAMSAMLPALRAAQAAAPVGAPPYVYGARTSIRTGREEAARSVDPYPVKTYKGRYRTPGFARRNLGRKSSLSRDGQTVTVKLGVKPEAFYALSFYELGTSSIARRPWLVPAFRASLAAIDVALQARLRALIDKAAQ